MATTLTLSYPDYLDKVHGGWIGKCIGGAIGALQENNKSLMNYTIDNVFPATIPPNDDLDLQVLYLQEVLEKKGSFITPVDLGEAFAAYNLCLANEYSIAIKNIELGIVPPYSGSHNNDYFHHSMGCPIRSELWGFIAPGHPDVAARYAAMDGVIDHDEESVYGEQFYAAMEAQSFVDHDLRQLIAFGLRYVPAGTALDRCIRFAMAQYDAGVPWQTTRERLIRQFGAADASYSVINIGITIMALLYGEGDFTRTMLTAVNCGYDTDCTAATAGAILGAIAGARQIPAFWLEKIGEDVVIGTVDIKRHSDKIIDLAIDTCGAGLSLARDGVTQIAFTDVPAGVAPSLPLPAPAAPVKLDVRYEGAPSIGPGEPARAALVASNLSGKPLRAVASLTLPPALACSIQRVELALAAGEQLDIPLQFTVRPDARELPQRNLVGVRLDVVADGGGSAGATADGWAAADGAADGSAGASPLLEAPAAEQGQIAALEMQFGLSGAARMRLAGPFWDNFDTAVHEADPYEGKMPTDLRAMFNGYVNLDRPYIGEFFAIDAPLPDGIDVNFHTDKLTPHHHISYKGPCCVYLVQDIISPDDKEEVHILLGNETPYKFWLNGELLATCTKPDMWMPYNHGVVAPLRAGLNRIAIKLASYGQSMAFSYQMRSVRTKLHLFTDLASVLHHNREEE